jgi:hypothetical protein
MKKRRKINYRSMRRKKKRKGGWWRMRRSENIGIQGTHDR